MRVVQFLTAWANAPFTIAFGVAASVALLQASGALSLLADDADHDADADVDADADADGDADGDADEKDYGKGRCDRPRPSGPLPRSERVVVSAHG